jgi:antitoxin VapB
MAQTMTAKLFRNGASQAVRLPAEFRFEGTEVFISRDEATGNVVLSERPGIREWEELFRELREIPETPEFMADRPMNQIPEERDIFGLEDER